MLPSPSGTERGVADLRRSALLAAAMAAASTSFFIPFGLARDQAALFLAFVIAIVGYILGIAALVYFFLGLWRVYSSRSEHGPDHRRDVEIAVLLALLASILAIFGFFLGLPGSFNPGPFRVATTLSTVSAACVGLSFLIAVQAFVAPRDRLVGLCGAIALAEAIPVRMGVLLLAIGFPQLGLNAVVFLVSAVGGAIELVGYALLRWVYTVARDRLRAGGLAGAGRPTTPGVATPLGSPSVPAPGEPQEPPSGI